jgi:hypothetical protein
MLATKSRLQVRQLVQDLRLTNKGRGKIFSFTLQTMKNIGL